MGCFSLKPFRCRRQRRSGARDNIGNSASHSASTNSNPRTYRPIPGEAKLVVEALPQSSQRRPILVEQDKLGNLSKQPTAGDFRISPPIAHKINNEAARSALDLVPNLSKSTVHQTPQNKEEPTSGSTAITAYAQSERGNAQKVSIEPAGQESQSPQNVSTAKFEQPPRPNSRSEHFKKFEIALKKRLKDDELQTIFRLDSSGPSQKSSDVERIVYNAVESLRFISEKNPTNKTKRILVVLDKAAKIGDVAIQHHPDVVALVWAALRLLLQVAVDNLELKELVEDTMEIVAKALETCGFYEMVYISSGNNLKSVARLGDAIAELYAAIVLFSVRAKKHLEGSSIGKSLKRTLTSTNTELQSLAGEVEAKERVLYNFASMVNTEDHQRRLEELYTVVNEIKNSQKSTLEKKQEVTLRECRIWLGGLTRDLEYERNRKLHVAGTCQWILDSESFKAWMIEEVDTLFAYGIPGAGKSVLQSFILERLKELRSKNPVSYGPILYFFFKNGNPKTESQVTMMATLIDQLIQQHQSPQLVELLNEARMKSNTNQCEDFTQLWDLFIRLVNVYGAHGPRIPILLDALDECSVREEFLQYIASPLDWKALGIKFLLTSRPEDDIMKALTSSAKSNKCSTTSTIKLVGEQVDRDIIHFVEDQITRKYYRLQQFKEQIIETVPKKAEGMFRYAALVLEELDSSTKNVEETLKSIPSGLYSIYIWILEHLSDKDLLLRKTVFTWVALAFRPLTVHEMALAFAAGNHDRSKTEFDPAKWVLVDKQRILKACGPLVEVTSEDTIAFTHFSVKEFILAEKWEKENPYDSISPLVAKCLIHDARIGHGSILKTCMTQLLSNLFLESLTKKDNIYSISYWLEHAMYNGNLNEDKVDHWLAVDEFLSGSNQCFSSWLERVPPLSLHYTPLNYRDGENLQINPIHVMAAFDLHIPLKKAIKSTNSNLKMDLNMHDHRGRSPLFYAASAGRIETVKLLLGGGAEVDNKDRNKKTPLSYAAAKGNTEIVKLLLERGADIGGKNRTQKTPLSHAAASGRTETVKLLLESGADIDSKDSDLGTPLSYAAYAYKGFETVKLLLERGADIDSKNSTQRTPLSYAAAQGNTETVRLLLESGADIDSKDRTQKPPLSHAAASGRTETVKLLLESGADIDSKDSDQRTPLSYAASAYEGFETVKLLFERGADIDNKDSTQRTPLCYAAAQGNTETVRLFLESGADIDSKDSTQRTPLSYAVAQGDAEIVKLLLERGSVDIDSKDSDQRTPLSYAAQWGSTQTIKLLLESGSVDIDSKDSDQRTPLSYAAERGNTDIVKLLLESGADIDSKGSDQRTPLSYAAARGNTETVGLLLERGANIESKDSNQRTLLSYAAVNGDTAAVKLLLERGADIHSKDSNQRTPLSYAAAKRWNTETVGLLLEKGADIDSKDSNQRTPLSYAASEWNTEMVKLFLESDADIDSKDSNLKTPLSYAAAVGDAETVGLLLERGSIDIESKDIDQRTPLSYAAAEGDAETVKLLLESGADIESKDSNQRTPLSYAVRCGYTETVKLLLGSGAIIDSKDSNQRTLLSYATMGGETETVKLLLESGADIESKDNNQRTPLSYATMGGETETVKLLLENGATIDSKDIDHITPLSLAAGNGYTKLVKLLSQRGAELEVKGKDGRTPLEWARINNHTEVVELLLEYRKLSELCRDGAYE